MPSYERVAAQEPWIVDIDWSRPSAYENAKENADDADAWLYMILGYYGSSERKIFYIGKAVNSYVKDRLRQPDHQRRQARLARAHPKHHLGVSMGKVRVRNGNITDNRIDQIETMLIYTANDIQPHVINKKKIWSLRIKEPYVIRNRGYRRPLPKEIHHGIFVR